MLRNKVYLTVLFFVFFLTVCGQENNEKIVRIYKQIDTVQLKMEIYQPAKIVKSKKYPTIIFYFGGGWQSGSISQFAPFAVHCVERGLIAVLVDYRVKSRHKTSPFESLKDAKSAIRYLRTHAKELNINPKMIIASGGSAGGHLASACYTNETINEITDNLKISAKPNALVLFNPVIDNGKGGYGYERIGERYLEFSPMHNIHKGFPPTINFQGTNDKLIPVATAKKFKQKIDSVGSRCELYLYDGQEHGFFNKKDFHQDIFVKMDTFLNSLNIK
jgi:acetyl esterase/lipase